MPKLILFSGPPGVGKSTLSYRLGKENQWAVVAKDQIDRSLELENVVEPIASYRVMLGLAQLNLGLGVSLVLDAVFTKQGFRMEAIEIAKNAGAEFYAIVCTCSSDEIWKERVRTRGQMVDGWTAANWAEVEQVRESYEAWQTPHLVLDAVNPLEENYRRVEEYLDKAN